MNENGAADEKHRDAVFALNGKSGSNKFNMTGGAGNYKTPFIV